MPGALGARQAAGYEPSRNQAGRSPFFLIFDEKGTLIQAIKNPYKDEGRSGISTVDLLASKGITVIVAESYGPRIVEVMKNKRIRAVEFKGTAGDAVKRVMQSK